MVGIHGAGQVKQKPFRVFLAEQPFGLGRQPVSPQAVAVIGFEKLLLLQHSYDSRLIAFAARQTGKLSDRQFAGYGGQFEQFISLCLSAGEWVGVWQVVHLLLRKTLPRLQVTPVIRPPSGG